MSVYVLSNMASFWGTLPETNIFAPEDQRLEDENPLGAIC